MVMVMQRDALLQTTMRMLEHVAQCVRRDDPSGAWILRLGDPRHDHRAGEPPDAQNLLIGAEFLAQLAAASRTQRPEITEVDEASPDEVEKPEMPVNARPIDPKWLERCDAAAEVAAGELGTYVVMMVVQDGGKLLVVEGGEALAQGEAKVYCQMLNEDPVRFFIQVARVMQILKDSEDRETRQ